MAVADGVKSLQAKFDGEIILPSQTKYDEARALFNLMIDRRPSVIAQCASNDDVTRALAFGREAGLEIAVRGGGHSVAGTSSTDGGVVIDLRRMNSVSIDPVRQIARVGGGALMTDLDSAAQQYNLVTTGGRVSTTGVGGFTLGGGSGWVERKYGLAADNLLSVELITAEGTVVRASETENPELFWGLHGGGGNFGVATAFEFKLYPLSSISFALMVWQPSVGESVTRRYRDMILEASDEVGGGLFFFTADPEPFIPGHLHGKLTLGALVTHTGSIEELRETVRPLREIKPDGEMFEELPYAEFNGMFDDPPGYRNYWSAEYLDSFPDEAVALFCARSQEMIVPSPSQSIIFPLGGAVRRGAAAGYPMPYRQANWVVHPFGLWTEPSDDERGIQWTREVRNDLKPWSTGDVYLNFTGDEGEGRVIAGFGRENYERLAKIKAQYDPENVFRLNHNVKPNISS